MTELTDFLDNRVIGVRQCWDVEFPAGATLPAPAIALSCGENEITVVVLPTVGSELMHLEVQMFVSGEHAEPEARWSEETPGVLEMTLRRPLAPSTQET